MPLEAATAQCLVLQRTDHVVMPPQQHEERVSAASGVGLADDLGDDRPVVVADATQHSKLGVLHVHL
jgi:hypothetical protein